MSRDAETADVMTGECDPRVVAGWAAEAVRAVNRLTLVAPDPTLAGWEGVCDIYDVLVELCVLVERLPQALGQLARHLERPTAGVHYRSDASTDESPEALVAAAVVALESARRGAYEVARDLATAQNSMCHIGSSSS